MQFAIGVTVLECSFVKHSHGPLGVNFRIFQTNIITFTLLMLVDVFTLHILLNPHIVFIVLFILYIFSHIWCVYYIIFIVCNTP
jgi:hypothetical protein